MKITEVKINNWNHPGEDWWSNVESSPDKPLIDATISMTLSWNEYKELTSREKRETAFV